MLLLFNLEHTLTNTSTHTHNHTQSHTQSQHVQTQGFTNQKYKHKYIQTRTHIARAHTQRE